MAAAALPSDMLPSVGGAGRIARGLAGPLLGGSTPSYPKAGDLWVGLYALIVLCVLRKLAFVGVLVPVARYAGAKDEAKVARYMWDGVLGLLSTWWLLHFCMQRAWFWDTALLWENIVALPRAQVMEPQFKLFYMVQLGYHTLGFAWLAQELRKPDSAKMLVHHLATVLLIVGSYLTNHGRIGLLVLLVHDSGNVFVCAAKGAHACAGRVKFSANIIFPMMMLVWAYTRLWLFPSWVIWSTRKYPWALCSATQYWGGVGFVALMCTLLVLHWLWFRTFVQMAVDLVCKGVARDRTEPDSAPGSPAKPAPDLPRDCEQLGHRVVV